MSQEMTLELNEAVAESTRAAPKKRSQWLEVWHRLKRNKMAMLGLVILSVVVLAAIFAGCKARVLNIGWERMNLAGIFLPGLSMVPESR